VRSLLPLALAAISPAVALVASGCYLLPTHASALWLIVGGTSYLLFFLGMLQPILIRRALGERPTARNRVALRHLIDGLRVSGPAELSQSFETALQVLYGAEIALLLTWDARGRLFVYGGEASDGEVLAQDPDTLRALCQQSNLLRVGRVAPTAAAEIRAAHELAARLRCNWVFPLGRAGSMLALVLARIPGAIPGRGEDLLRTMVANLHLLLSLDAIRTGVSSVATELSSAGPVQEALIPDEALIQCQGLRIYGAYRPAAHCGGDFWTWADLGGSKLLVFLGDATGHGVPSAMLTAAVKGLVEAHCTVRGSELDIDELIADLDRLVARVGGSEYGLTGIVAVVDNATGTMDIANAGHNFPLLVSRHNERMPAEALLGNGDFLGGGAPAQVARYQRPLPSGAKLVLHTDGVIEAVSRSGRRQYGERRLRKVLGDLIDAPADEVVRGVLDDVKDFAGDGPLADDMTVVIVEAPA
jgi:hypothetical protein